MKTLYLLRHGQAEPKQIEPDDTRNLTLTGQKESLLTAEKLLKEGLRPDIILSSHANRAHQTAQIVAETLAYPVKNILIERDIYYTDERSLLDLITGYEDKYASLMIAGHNPSISYLAKILSKNQSHDMPTAGVLVLQWQTTKWNDILNHPAKEILYFEPEV